MTQEILDYARGGGPPHLSEVSVGRFVNELCDFMERDFGESELHHQPAAHPARPAVWRQPHCSGVVIWSEQSGIEQVAGRQSMPQAHNSLLERIESLDDRLLQATIPQFFGVAKTNRKMLLGPERRRKAAAFISRQAIPSARHDLIQVQA